MHSRRNFLRTSATSAIVLASGAGAQTLVAQAPGQTPTQTPTQRPPKLLDADVLDFVKAAHTDLDKTRTMLDANPALLNATWDWGGGDFETALGGASHMGRPDIAGLLLERGARIDIFCATMMGMLATVQSVVEKYPAAVGWKGPHGISMLKHAQMGKQIALVDYLTSKGAV